MKKPKVCILRTAGTNCDRETAFAFSLAGGECESVHINQLIDGESVLDKYSILTLCGGFSYGDDVAAGKILANELKYKLMSSVERFIKQGKLIIGICNGFQILVKSGLLPGNDSFRQEASLIINDSGKFESRWVYLKSHQSQDTSQKCVWTNGLPEVIYLPVAHGEGKFVAQSQAVIERLRKNNQVVFQYCSAQGEAAGYPGNPNGSQESIAGISDATGRILGLMPHPERHIDFLQHPRHRRGPASAGDGFFIFKNGVDYARKYL
ncbi:MAG: phosphoribosylformylglycinamidine synthase I [Candidatus Omnitrophota bacterium]|jgi:phosphoribosylformylglycinamidine synthase